MTFGCTIFQTNWYTSWCFLNMGELKTLRLLPGHCGDHNRVINIKFTEECQCLTCDLWT